MGLSLYGHHLSKPFDPNLVLDDGSEKLMEPVMHRCKPVLRKAMQGKEFDLKKFTKLSIFVSQLLW